MRSEAYFAQAGDDSLGMIYDLEPDSRRMIVAFAALPGTNLDVRPFAFHTMLADLDVKVAFLRDHLEAWYQRGVAGVGANIDSVAAFLRNFGRNAEEMVMIGGSSGGYAALLFGSLLSCEVHAFMPQTFIDPDRRLHNDKRFQREFETFRRTSIPAMPTCGRSWRAQRRRSTCTTAPGIHSTASTPSGSATSTT